MRTLPGWLLGLACVATPNLLPAQQNFEGIIAYRMTMEDLTISLTHMSKGSRLRTEMQMPGLPEAILVLMDMDTRVAWSVMPSMGVYVEMDLNTLMNQLPITPEMRELAKETPRVEPLGTRDSIAGIPCQNYRFVQGATEMEGCIATGIGFFMGGTSPTGMGGPLAELGIDFTAYNEMFKDGMVPLRMRMKTADKWSDIMEATLVERKVLDDELFRLPPNLKKMEIPGVR